MEKKVYGLENIEVFDKRELGENFTLIIVKGSLNGVYGNYKLLSYKLSKEEKEKTESARYYMAEDNHFAKRVEGIGHGWNDDNGNEFDTCEGRYLFKLKSPGFVLMEHKIPNEGKKFTLYVDELFYQLGNKVEIPSQKYLSELCNAKCYGKSEKENIEDNVVTKKAYDKMVRRLQKGRVSKEQFDSWLNGRMVEEQIPEFENVVPEKVDFEESPEPEAKSAPSVTDIGYELIRQKQLYEEELRKLYEEKISATNRAFAELYSIGKRFDVLMTYLKEGNARFEVEKAKLDENYQKVVVELIKT